MQSTHEQDGSASVRERATTVVLVDDEPLIRRALRDVLSHAGLDVLGEAGSALAAVAAVRELQPRVVLLDLKLPDSSGPEAIERLALLRPRPRILVLARAEQNRVVEAVVAGASGYILKSAPPEAIVRAVRKTAAGETVLSSRVAGKLLERIRERDTPATAGEGDSTLAIRQTLTVRELEIFQRLASGHSNREIACELSLSSNTVSSHVASILAKLHLHNRIEAAVEAVRSGLA